MFQVSPAYFLLVTDDFFFSPTPPQTSITPLVKTICVEQIDTWLTGVGEYGRPFVSKLWHDIRAVFSHVYLRSFLLCGVFIPKYMHDHFLTKVHIIYMHTKTPYICITNKHMVYGVTESRSIRGTKLYHQQKTPSCTMELKSNFSLNQAWPQWPC